MIRTRSCDAGSKRKGMIFLTLNKENLQDRAALEIWCEKVRWSIIYPRFLAVFEGVMVDVPNWMVKLWWNDGFDGTTSSSALAICVEGDGPSSSKKCMLDKLRCEQLSSDHQDGTKGIVECHQHSSDMKSHVSEWQNLGMPCRQRREVVQELSPEAPQ